MPLDLSGAHTTDARAIPEKVESVVDLTTARLIHAVCWVGGQQICRNPMPMT
jgi:hypothetical protein